MGWTESCPTGEREVELRYTTYMDGRYIKRAHGARQAMTAGREQWAFTWH